MSKLALNFKAFFSIEDFLWKYEIKKKISAKIFHIENQNSSTFNKTSETFLAKYG